LIEKEEEEGKEKKMKKRRGRERSLLVENLKKCQSMRT
jgi:hypothetical protein